MEQQKWRLPGIDDSDEMTEFIKLMKSGDENGMITFVGRLLLEKLTSEGMAKTAQQQFSSYLDAIDKAFSPK